MTSSRRFRWPGTIASESQLSWQLDAGAGLNTRESRRGCGCLLRKATFAGLPFPFTHHSACCEQLWCAAHCSVTNAICPGAATFHFCVETSMRCDCISYSGCATNAPQVASARLGSRMKTEARRQETCGLAVTAGSNIASMPAIGRAVQSRSGVTCPPGTGRYRLIRRLQATLDGQQNGTTGTVLGLLPTSDVQTHICRAAALCKMATMAEHETSVETYSAGRRRHTWETGETVWFERGESKRKKSDKSGAGETSGACKTAENSASTILEELAAAAASGSGSDDDDESNAATPAATGFGGASLQSQLQSQAQS